MDDGGQDDLATQFLDDASEPEHEWQTKRTNAIYDLENYLKSELEDQAAESTHINSMFEDFLQYAIDSVNFREIAENWIDNVYDEWLESNSEADEDAEEE
jgi:hypothetical protein